MTSTELMARMGELVVSTSPTDVLVSIGLGSCIGLAVIENGFGRAGLAHVMLPSSESGTGASPAKFADLAVPALVQELTRLGAVKARLGAVVVGGAQMFPGMADKGLDIGARNERAVLDALRHAGVRVDASETGGGKGRTIRIDLGKGRVTVKEAGGRETPVLEVR